MSSKHRIHPYLPAIATAVTWTIGAALTIRICDRRIRQAETESVRLYDSGFQHAIGAMLAETSSDAR